MNLENRKIILFDGHCNLCNGAVQFIIKRDKKRVFRFASLQSPFGMEITGGKQDLPDSIIYLDNEKTYVKSDAALKIAGNLEGPWKIAGVFKVLPLRFRDWLYDIIARNRYQWFGRRDQCMVPTPDLIDRFIDS